MNIDLKLNKKQAIAWKKLHDDHTTQIMYGGSAGGGKTFISCAWAIIYCLNNPGIRGLIGQAFLKTLKTTTMATFWDIVNKWGISHLVNYNDHKSLISFTNGSSIILKDLYLKPSDSEFEGLGGLELTFVIIDEAGMVSREAFEVLSYSRIRYKLKENNLIRKTLIVSNPSKGWLYDEFYKPYKDNTLEKEKFFIRASVEDNKYLPVDYIPGLNKLQGSMKERLLYGNWDYGDETNNLFFHDDVYDCFFQNPVYVDKVEYLSVDVATRGDDKTVICRWRDLCLMEIYTIDKNTAKELRDFILKIALRFHVKRSNIIIDSTGNDVADFIEGSTRFVSNHRPFKGENFNHLKSQIFYKLSTLIRAGKITIKDNRYIDKICQELEAFKIHKPDDDGKAQITPKSVVKSRLGHSPDFAEAIAMRAYFEVDPPQKLNLIII